MANEFNELNRLVLNGVLIGSVTVHGGRPSNDGIIPPHGTPISPRSEAAAEDSEEQSSHIDIIVPPLGDLPSVLPEPAVDGSGAHSHPSSDLSTIAASALEDNPFLLPDDSTAPEGDSPSSDVDIAVPAPFTMTIRVGNNTLGWRECPVTVVPVVGGASAFRVEAEPASQIETDVVPSGGDSASLQPETSAALSGDLSSLGGDSGSLGGDSASLQYDTPTAPSGDLPSLGDANDSQPAAAKHISSLVSSVLSGQECDAAIEWLLNNVKEVVNNASIDIIDALRTIYTEAPEDFISTDTQVLKLFSKVLERLTVSRVEEVMSAIAEGGPFAIAIFKAERMLLKDKTGSLTRTQRALVVTRNELEAAQRDIEEGLTAEEAEEVYEEAGKLEERAEYAERKLQKMRRLQREMRALEKDFEEEQKEHAEVLRVKEVERKEARRMHVKDHAYLKEEIRCLKRKREDEKVEAAVKLAKAERELLDERKISDFFAMISGADQ